MKYLVIYWDEYNSGWNLYTWESNKEEAKIRYNQCKKKYRTCRLIEAQILTWQDE